MLINTPPMGWNSWNTFGQNINEETICQAADKFVELGLPKAGYQYIVIDDAWQEPERDPNTHEIVPNKVKFPNGMKAVADYVHSKGLKFGMYSCAGLRTCCDFPGSYDHEFVDAKMFARFGCDFLKYDNCYRTASSNGQNVYRRMGLALRNCGRDILFSACNWGSDDVWSWIRSAGAHMYRSTGDIFDNFESFKNIAESQIEKYCYSAPNCFNDIDMLTVGMFGKGNVGTGGCNAVQYKSQFALWCFLGSPLMLGCDLRSLDPEILKLITNKELIAINQDPDCRPAFKAGRFEEKGNSYVILAKLLENGDIALGFFNFSNKPVNAHVLFDDFGLLFSADMDLDMREVIDGKDIGVQSEHFRVRLDAFDCQVYRAKLVSRK